MSFVAFFFVIFLVIIKISCVAVFENNPIILISQGVIRNGDSLPISIFWYHPNFTTMDWLFVYTKSTRRKYEDYFKIESSTGFHELSNIEPSESLVVIDIGIIYIIDNYCAVILSGNGTLGKNSSCKSKVQWMYDRRDILREFSLRNLVIPGTHQSAAYVESYDDQSYFSSWVSCQTKSIKSQLMDGIRYLDLRPGYIYVDGKKKWVLTHSIFSLISMDEVVTQITEFMALSKDIIIVSFKEFAKGFNSDVDHEEFIEYIHYALGRYAHPRRSWPHKLKEFWGRDLRLILSYDHSVYLNTAILWPLIPQYWGDMQTINGLHSYLDSIHQKDWNITDVYAAMVELTHSISTTIQDTFYGGESLRHWAQRLSKVIPHWYTVEWVSKTNIIAVDFYQTSGIADLAIQLNERRERNYHPNSTKH